MVKSTPSLGRIAAMVIFALSCFGLLLFLWLAFGGSIPLKPKGYRFQASFAEATQLAKEADVRISGVPVGKVKTIEPDTKTGRTTAVIEMEEIQLSFGNFGRVRFRTVFKKSRPLPGKPDVKFKTVVEDLEIQCKEEQYRLSSTIYLDAKGEPVHVYKADGDEEWEELRSYMMQRLLDSACRMIEKKKV